jgi:prepilin signal peptidase PulO-like enzyme (type II secretory pathway)
MVIFYILLCVLSIIKSFQILFFHRYIKRGYITCKEIFKGKKFLVIAIICFFAFGIVAFIENKSFETVRLLDLTGACVLVSLTDLKSKQIPDEIVFSLGMVQVCMILYEYGAGAVINILFCIFVFLITFLISYLSKGQMGMGDVKLLSVICLSLGILNTVWITILSLVLSLFAGLYLLIFHKKSIKTEMPFAPFVTISVIVNVILNYL